MTIILLIARTTLHGRDFSSTEAPDLGNSAGRVMSVYAYATGLSTIEDGPRGGLVTNGLSASRKDGPLVLLLAAGDGVGLGEDGGGLVVMSTLPVFTSGAIVHTPS